jgi:hypothetical protein
MVKPGPRFGLTPVSLEATRYTTPDAAFLALDRFAVSPENGQLEFPPLVIRERGAYLAVVPRFGADGEMLPFLFLTHRALAGRPAND